MFYKCGHKSCFLSVQNFTQIDEATNITNEMNGTNETASDVDWVRVAWGVWASFGQVCFCFYFCFNFKINFRFDLMLVQVYFKLLEK